MHVYNISFASISSTPPTIYYFENILSEYNFRFLQRKWIVLELPLQSKLPKQWLPELSLLCYDCSTRHTDGMIRVGYKELQIFVNMRGAQCMFAGCQAT